MSQLNQIMNFYLQPSKIFDKAVMPNIEQPKLD